jgi:hypothetical protein
VAEAARFVSFAATTAASAERFSLAASSRRRFRAAVDATSAAAATAARFAEALSSISVALRFTP